MLRSWHTDVPRRLIGRGHPVGDFLGAPEWEVLARGDRSLRLRAGLPERVKNSRGELFGGFTPTYVDFVSLHLFHLGQPAGGVDQHNQKQGRGQRRQDGAAIDEQ